MIHLPASVRVYLCLSACDMRKSFDGLHALVRDYLELDAFAGHLFVFASRRRDRLKILYWDRDGFAIWSKRLEAGTYALPLADSADERRREITAPELGARLRPYPPGCSRRPGGSLQPFAFKSSWSPADTTRSVAHFTLMLLLALKEQTVPLTPEFSKDALGSPCPGERESQLRAGKRDRRCCRPKIRGKICGIGRVGRLWL